MAFFDTLLNPIMVVVAWIMVQFHTLFTWLGLDPDGGVAWSLSIVGLVVVIRILLIPLFVKQIRASRGLQLIQPQMQRLQAKYKGKTDPASRQAMQQEMMQLYRDAGTNPFASCLPILAQSPIFFALFRVLYSLPQVAAGEQSIGPLTPELAASAEESTIFGAPLASTFMRADEYPNPTAVRVVTVILIILMSVTTFTTQRQLTMKNMPAAALDNPIARQQKMLMYVLPIVFAVSGVNFPIGVLLYWFTTNLWSMGQQFYVIRNMPAPGSAAEEAYKARKARRAARRGIPLVPEEPAPTDTKPVAGQRVQPKRKDRQKPTGQPQDTQQKPAGQPTPQRKTPASGAKAPGAKGSGAKASGAKGSGGQTQPRPPERPRTTASGQKAARPRPAPPGKGQPSSAQREPGNGAPGTPAGPPKGSGGPGEGAKKSGGARAGSRQPKATPAPGDGSGGSQNPAS